MSKLSKADQEQYAALAERAERGELKPQGDGVYGEEATRLGRELLLVATGASTIEEATHLALGRPKLADEGNETKTWKVRIPAELDRTVREAAKRRGMSVSAYIRLAAARQVEADALTA